jgi:hypothetical protein
LEKEDGETKWCFVKFNNKMDNVSPRKLFLKFQFFKKNANICLSSDGVGFKSNVDDANGDGNYQNLNGNLVSFLFLFTIFKESTLELA